MQMNKKDPEQLGGNVAIIKNTNFKLFDKTSTIQYKWNNEHAPHETVYHCY